MLINPPLLSLFCCLILSFDMLVVSFPFEHIVMQLQFVWTYSLVMFYQRAQLLFLSTKTRIPEQFDFETLDRYLIRNSLACMFIGQQN